MTAVSNLALGSLLMALEALDGWVDRNVPTQAQALEQRANGRQGALLPQSEWEATYGRPETDRTRLAIMGMAASANALAVRATRFVLRTGGLAAETARWPLDHIFLFRPLRYGMDRVAEAEEPADRPVGRGGKGAGHREPRRRRGFVGSRSPGVRGYRDRGTPRPGARPGDRRRARYRHHPGDSSRRCASTRSRWIMGVDRAWATLRGRPQPEIATPDFAVAIPDKKPDPKETGRPALPRRRVRRDREPSAGLFDRLVRADHRHSSSPGVRLGDRLDLRP